MRTTTKSMDNLLGSAELAISNALTNEEIKSKLLEYNYDDVRLNEGLELHKKAHDLFKKQKDEYSDQFKSKEDLDAAYKNANPLYIEQITLARFTFKNEPSVQIRLGLIGKRKKTVFGWIEQAFQFYDSVLASEEIIRKLSRFNITKEKLEEGRLLIQKLKEANLLQEKEKGGAQDKI